MKVKEYKITDLDRKRAIEFVEASKALIAAKEKLQSFGQRFQPCDSTDKREIQMYQTIEKLALSLGVDTLEVEHREFTKEPHQKEFTYDGIKFFQLCSEEEKYIGTYRKFKEIKLKVREGEE